MSIKTLQEKIRKLKNPTVLDMSFDPAVFPEPILAENRTDVERYHSFARKVLKELAPLVPAVRFKLSSFALLGAFGIEVMRDTAEYAQFLGYYVLVDVPHTTSLRETQISAEYWMNQDSIYSYDGLIIHSYIGSDGIKPYLKWLEKGDKSLFVILRTANKSASELQDLLTGNGWMHLSVAEKAAYLGKTLDCGNGYSQVAGFAAANSQETLIKLRRKYPNMFLLLDGYDFQDRCAKCCSPAFDVFGYGAAVCVGESVLAAWREYPDAQDEYLLYAADAVKHIRQNIARYVRIL